MAAITVQMINELRGLTNAGMMDCKGALKQTDGDMEAAIKILREKGLAIQVKRADKESKQGIIMAIANGDAIGMAEVNCETDFVAKTDGFRNFAQRVTEAVAAGDEDVATTLNDDLVALVSSTGENLKIRRVSCVKPAGTGKVFSYIHMGGVVGVLVDVACEKPETIETAEFQTFAKDLCLQVAAAAPRYLTSSEVPQDLIEGEKDIYRTQVQGKPANIVEGILSGKIKKFFGEICLIDQAFVKEPKQTITDLMKDVSKATGDTISIRRYVRFQLGAS